MAYTQSDLDQLQRSIAKGIKSAQMGGERVDFRDLSEMIRLETKIKRALGQVPAKRRIHFPITSGGFR